MANATGPLNWYGGKARLAPWIHDHLPPHHRYVEVFGGGAAVLFSKPPSPIEIYNDLDDGLVGFFRVLRDPVLFPVFVYRIQLVPYSRAEFYRFKQTWQEPDDPVERAVRWFSVARWSFSGDWGHSWGFDLEKPSVIARWLSVVRELPDFHQRLQSVFIEHDDWRAILDRYDLPETCWYLDPPYVPDTWENKSYRHRMTRADHQELVDRLLTLQGMILLSGYASDFYRPLEHAGWHRLERHVALRAGNLRLRPHETRQECLWINPQAWSRQTQLSLWDSREVNGVEQQSATVDSPDSPQCESVAPNQ